MNKQNTQTKIEAGQRQLLCDLQFVLEGEWFPRECLIHLRNHFHRLVRGSYEGRGKTGCMFFILTGTLPKQKRIRSRESLTTYFTGGHGANYRERPVYQPARWLVRAWDGQHCARYHGVTLDTHTLWEALEQAILKRADATGSTRRGKLRVGTVPATGATPQPVGTPDYFHAGLSHSGIS